MSERENEMDDGDRDKLMSRCYGQAQTELRERHREEFNTLYQKYLAAVGIEWTPRPTPEQVALDTITKLLGEYPGLAERLAETLAREVQDGEPGGAETGAEAR